MLLSAVSNVITKSGFYSRAINPVLVQTRRYQVHSIVQLSFKKRKENMPEHLAQGSTEPPLSPGNLRLYGMRFCPFDQRAHLVLIAKNIPHDNVFINLSHKPDWYLKRIPSTKVPGLIVEGEALYESLIIADFLDEKYPERPLHSKDPIQKAKDRILLENFSRVISAFYKLAMNSKSPGEEVSNLIMEFGMVEKELTIRKSKFFGGEEPGMVDYMIWPWFERLDGLKLILGNKFEMPEKKLPQLVSWMEAMKEDSVVKKYWLSPEVHAKYMTSYIAGTPDFSILC